MKYDRMKKNYERVKMQPDVFVVVVVVRHYKAR